MKIQVTDVMTGEVIDLTASFTTEHPASSYGIPVMLIDEWDDAMSHQNWILGAGGVVAADKDEEAAFNDWHKLIDVMCSEPATTGKLSAPSADAVYAFLQHHSITGSQAARMMYLSDSRQVRKYTGGASPRQMDGARWFALHAHVLLSPEQIAEIEAAMEADCQGSMNR